MAAKKEKKMGFFKQIMGLISKAIHGEFGMVTTNDDKTIEIIDDTQEAFWVVDGIRGEAVPDGTYTLDDGATITVASGKVTSTTEATEDDMANTSTIGDWITGLIAGKKTADLTEDAIIIELSTKTGISLLDFAAVLKGEGTAPTAAQLLTIAEYFDLTEADIPSVEATDEATDEAAAAITAVAEANFAALKPFFSGEKFSAKPVEFITAIEKCAKPELKAVRKLTRSKFKLSDTPITKESLGAFILEDKTLIIIRPENGEAWIIDEECLWTNGLLATGTYKLNDGRTLVIKEGETITYEEGTDWEWTFTPTVVDLDASDITLDEIVKWIPAQVEALSKITDRKTGELKATIISLNAEIDALRKAPGAKPVGLKKPGAKDAEPDAKPNITIVEKMERLNRFLNRTA